MPGPGTLLHTAGGSDPDEGTGSAEEGPAGAAFSLLYDLFEQRVFNVCHRLLGAPDDAAAATQAAFLAVLTGPRRRAGQDSNFRVYLFGAAHDACRELLGSGADRAPGRAAPSSRSGGVFVDPARAKLLSTLQRDVREANGTLSADEREALALRELEYFSYEEIATIMRTDVEAVARLVAAARVHLRDALRRSELAQAAIAVPDCRRAMPLIGMAHDGEPAGEHDRAWLSTHAAGCHTCRACREAMEEAGISYRAWLRVAPPRWLREQTVARAGGRATGEQSVPAAEVDSAPPPEPEGLEPAARQPEPPAREASPAEPEPPAEPEAPAPGALEFLEPGQEDPAPPYADGEAEPPEPDPRHGEPEPSQPEWVPATEATQALPPPQRRRAPRDARRRFALGAASMLMLLLGIGAAMVLASGGGQRAARSAPEAFTEPAGGTTASAQAPPPIASPTAEAASPPSGRRSRTATAPRTTVRRTSAQLVAAPSSRPRRTITRVRRAPVPNHAQGGEFVPGNKSPSTTAKPAPTPASPTPPSPPGGVAAPSGEGCGTTSAGQASC
jgi:RNA polymerase sigma factor (sigma-70 family)